jgi:hypothetical protein
MMFKRLWVLMKLCIIAFLLFFLLPVCAEAALFGLWRLDENTGSTANDTSGNGNNGTLTNTPTWTTPCKSNACLDFDRASSEYVQIHASACIISTDDWTISAWIQPESGSNSIQIFECGEEQVGPSFGGFSFFVDSTAKLRCVANVGTSTCGC